MLRLALFAPAVLLVLSVTAGLLMLVNSPSAGDQAIVLAVRWLEPRAAAGGPPITFEIPEGEDASAIAQRLNEEGVIRHPLLFRILILYYDDDRALKSGRYTLPSDSGPFEIVQALKQGRPEDTATVTIPEGLRAEEIAALLEAHGVGAQDEFLQLVLSGKPPGAPRPWLADGVTSLEGYLFPDTYHVPAEYSTEAFLNLMLDGFEAHTPEALRHGGNVHGLTLYQVVTLASIVERETPHTQERPQVAGVFLNRLEQEIPLAADPTIQYALVPAGTVAPADGYWKRGLTVDDLKVASPYNSYVIPGLPPGPIANPGAASIAAVIHPTKSTYLFFVAKPDGSHAFSDTFEEHLRNIAKYQ